MVIGYGADAYNWCVVPDTSYDVILFPAIAVVLACLFQGRYSTTLVLLAGALLTGMRDSTSHVLSRDRMSSQLGTPSSQLF